MLNSPSHGSKARQSYGFFLVWRTFSFIFMAFMPFFEVEGIRIQYQSGFLKGIPCVGRTRPAVLLCIG